jgi:VWFA-related protein
LICAKLAFGSAEQAQQQSSDQQSTSGNSELSTRDTDTTFRVRVNLVLVRVVVRDAQGRAIPDLRQEDFELFDNRKPQTITSFSVETGDAPAPRSASKDGSGNGVELSSGKTPVLPQRFVAMVFDDMHMIVDDTTLIRTAGMRLLDSLAPSDRVAVFGTSGQLTQEFTDDRELLKSALMGIIPRPLQPPMNRDCPDIDFYMADLIQNKRDQQAMAVATEDALQCGYNGDTKHIDDARRLAETEAMRALTAGDTESEYTNRHIEDVLRRMSTVPGQRIITFISPGYLLTASALESASLIEKANRANVVINTIDARGLYVPDLQGDIANPVRDSYSTGGIKSSYRLLAQSAQSDILRELADGTGGTFFHNRNDIGEGMRLAVAAPTVSYVLGFSPKTFSVSGRFHTLSVKLAGKQKYVVQARRGYYTQQGSKDPEELAKQEIQEAVFSQEELRDLTAELQTQFFKPDQTNARLAVLAHVDLRGIRFRKEGDRSRDDLRIATAIFDQNGNLVTGCEKLVEMRLKEATYDRLSKSGLTVKSSFDIKPGTYMVRMVVRDVGGSQMATRNGAVTIPYN